MKKSIILLVLAAFAVSSWAQTYKLVYGGDTLSNGDTIDYTLTRSDVQYHLVSLPSIFILKTTSDDVFTDNNITYVQGNGVFHVSEVCGGGLCPQPGSYKLESGVVDSNKFLSLHYEFEGTPENGAYAMHRLTVGTIADSIEHGFGDTVGAPLSALTETTSVYIIVHHGDYHLGMPQVVAGEGFSLTPSVVVAGQEAMVQCAQGNSRVTLHDAAGRLISSVEANQGRATIATEGLASGMYLVRTSAAGQTSTKKLIVK